MSIFPYLQPPKLPDPVGEISSERRKMIFGFLPSIFFPFLSFLFFCRPACLSCTHMHTHHRYHTCTQRYTQTLNRHYAHTYHAHTHTDTHRHHTHMHTDAMDIYKDTLHRCHTDTHM